MNWVGKKLKSPEGNEAICVKDDNSPPYLFRELTVRFDNSDEIEKVILGNTGPNPVRSRDWAWLWERKWVKFGYM